MDLETKSRSLISILSDLVAICKIQNCTCLGNITGNTCDSINETLNKLRSQTIDIFQIIEEFNKTAYFENEKMTRVYK